MLGIFHTAQTIYRSSLPARQLISSTVVSRHEFVRQLLKTNLTGTSITPM